MTTRSDRAKGACLVMGCALTIWAVAFGPLVLAIVLLVKP